MAAVVNAPPRGRTRIHHQWSAVVSVPGTDNKTGQIGKIGNAGKHFQTLMLVYEGWRSNVINPDRKQPKQFLWGSEQGNPSSCLKTVRVFPHCCLCLLVDLVRFTFARARLDSLKFGGGRAAFSGR